MVDFNILVGKEKYIKAMFNVFCWLLKHDKIPIYGAENSLKNRYEMVNESFSNSLFAKLLPYEEYLEKIKEV